MSDWGGWSAWAEKRWDERKPTVAADETHEVAQTAPGWYADNERADRLRYWDGAAWTEHTAPVATPGLVKPSAAGNLALLAAAVVGLVMAMQSTSLLNGTTNLWIGAVIASAAGIAAWVLRPRVSDAVVVLTTIAAVLALASVLYAEHQMNEKRDEISHLLDDY